MFDLNTINARYFDVTIGKLVLQVEPPKIKVLKKIMALTKSRNEDALIELSEAVRLILNKNKTKCVVSCDVIDELDTDQLNEVIAAYFEWLGKVKNSPNS